MRISWNHLVESMDKLVPKGTVGRKLLMILAIVLLFEGISVVLLFSKAGLIAGFVSLALGILLVLLLYPAKEAGRESAVPQPSAPKEEDAPGIKLVDAIMRRIGNEYIVIAIGAAVILLVLLWNVYLSNRSGLGDLDTLTIMFGALLIVYPFISKKFKVEAVFSLMFLGLVVLFLVVPQAVMSANGDAGSSIGNWYVHYMLAAPFAGTLDLLGVPSSSSGDMVTIQFQDGSIQVLGISAYCAGLYSFSIFLAAFFSFVLVFERLPARLLSIVLAVGLVIAYLGNLFRMVVIGIVGYYNGIDALLWAHENVGWIIFLSWSAVFWYVLLGYISRNKPARSPGGPEPEGR
ncbi:MAG TPA: exosortase/archaeosortase family protein [Thermoplasmata archaeon]|jgi:archaeosortase C (PEF-CTERM variant)